MNNKFKYPRTPHFPWSEGCTSDDKMTTKEKVSKMSTTIVVSELDNSKFCYFESMMERRFGNDEDFPIVKEKMDNLIKLMESKLAEGEEEYEKFLELDLEDEVWYMI